VNPQAGKDIRRLASAASHTSDVSKMGIVRRVVLGAIESGVERIFLSADRNNLAARAIDGIDSASTTLELLDSPGTGSRHDTIAAAGALRRAGAAAVVVLGGDGTSRDVATGWSDVPCVSISTGTNNVFPLSVDATSAGLAAGLIATNVVPLDGVARQAKRIVAEATVAHINEPVTEIALVDLALIDTTFVGARAVQSAHEISAVLSCIAEPASTGLSSIAGRVLPTGRNEPGGVFLELASAKNQDTATNRDQPGLRVPISPGTFSTLHVATARRVANGETVQLHGPGVLALDGERYVRLEADDHVTARIETDGPHMIDVNRTLRCAVTSQTVSPAAPPALAPNSQRTATS